MYSHWQLSSEQHTRECPHDAQTLLETCFLASDSPIRYQKRCASNSAKSFIPAYTVGAPLKRNSTWSYFEVERLRAQSASERSEAAFCTGNANRDRCASTQSQAPPRNQVSVVTRGPSVEDQHKHFFRSSRSSTLGSLTDCISNKVTVLISKMRRQSSTGDHSVMASQLRLLRNSLDGEEDVFPIDRLAGQYNHQESSFDHHVHLSDIHETRSQSPNTQLGLRDRLGSQSSTGAFFSFRRHRASESEDSISPGSSKAQERKPVMHMHLPTFNSSRTVPRVFTPLLSPRSSATLGQQKGFFDAVTIQKSVASIDHDPLSRHPLSAPATPFHRPEETWFRVSFVPEIPQSGKEFVSQIPDHLPTSPICPKHPKNKSQGRGRCPIHGRNRTSEDSLSEEEDPPMQRKKDLGLFL